MFKIVFLSLVIFFSVTSFAAPDADCEVIGDNKRIPLKDVQIQPGKSDPFMPTDGSVIFSKEVQIDTILYTAQYTWYAGGNFLLALAIVDTQVQKALATSQVYNKSGASLVSGQIYGLRGSEYSMRCVIK